MRITQIEIKNFRSIQRLSFTPTPTTVICGINSSGKSNVMRAIRIALHDNPSTQKLAENVTTNAGPNSICQIEILFDKPTNIQSINHNLPQNTPFKYKISFKRTGSFSRQINGRKISDAEAILFLNSILLIYVPAIRDIAIDGLRPFKEALIKALNKQKGVDSILNLTSNVQRAIKRSGQAMLVRPNAIAKEWLNVDGLGVDTSNIELTSIFPAAGIQVNIGNNTFALNKLGTGHQSAVVIKLYRELGAGSGQAVIYLFEEPDNHLHPTSIQVIAQELLGCAIDTDSQVFLTTHSPYLLNHFDFSSILALKADENRLTQKRNINITSTPRVLRTTLSKYGLHPSEALLAKRVIVVEGKNDVNILRTFVELHTGMVPERQDILIISAGGKSLVSELCSLLNEIGADWRAVFDWDAVDSTSQPLLLNNLTPANKINATTSLQAIKNFVYKSGAKTTKFEKLINSALNELATPLVQGKFKDSVLGQFVAKTQKLNSIQQSSLASFAKKYQPKLANDLLETANTYIWKSDIETVVIPDRALNDAENHLILVRLLPGPCVPAQRKNTILRLVKSFAHEPETVYKLIKYLWDHGHYKKQEIIRSLNYLLN